VNKGLLRSTLIVLSLTIAAFSVFKYLASLKEKYDLLNSLNQAQEEAAILSKEKQNLLQDLEKEKELQRKMSQDNAELKEYLLASKDRITKLFKEVKETQDTIEQLSAQITLAKAENKALIEEAQEIRSNLTQVSQENEALKFKMSSIDGLKRAIRELKLQRRKMNLEIMKAKAKEFIEGNLGYLIRDGKPTYPAKIRIEVIPAPNK
jgi:chromosome segregation ATPase